VSLFRLAVKNIAGNAFRSGAVFLCAALVAGLALCATLVVRGAEASLRVSLERLGADLIVFPWGTMTEKISGVRLMSARNDNWMPATYTEKIAAVPGVAAVSPQLYLGAEIGTPYSSLDEIYLVAFDPETDFTVRPWLVDKGQPAVGPGEVLGGSTIAVPGGGEEIVLRGVRLRLAGRLESTGTSMDQALFMTFDTAAELVRQTAHLSPPPYHMPAGGISTILVKLGLNSSPHDVAVHILENVPSVVPLETPQLFQTERRQMIGLLRSVLGVLGFTWLLSLAFVGLVFSIAVNERRREIGVLRALGSPQNFVVQSLLAEGALLSMTGGLLGALFAALLISLNEAQLASLTGLPLAMPTPVGLALLALLGGLLALGSVSLAAYLPAWRISQHEAALVMRE
jgi:putative ABC transport system permease protein